MHTITLTEFRRSSDDALNRAAYAKEVVLVTRKGQRLVALIPGDILEDPVAFEEWALGVRSRMEYLRDKANGDLVSLDDLEAELAAEEG